MIAALAAVAVLVFVIAAAWLAKDGDGVRMAYYCSVGFVAVVVGLAALGGLARSMGEAIANPGIPCRGIRPAVFRAQGNLPAQQPRRFNPPPEQIPNFRLPNIPEPPGEPAVPFRFAPDCNAVSARSHAAGEAIRSGIMLAAVAALVAAHRPGMQRLLRGEDDHGG